MPRGGPDFGAYSPRDLTVPQLDPGELAVRLGAPSVFDRRGTTVFQQTGDNHARRWLVGEASPAQVRQNYYESPVSDYTWRLEGSGTAQILFRATVPYLGSSGVGHEMVALVDAFALLGIVTRQRTGSRIFEGGVRFQRDAGGNAIQFRDSTGTWTDTPTQPSYPTNTVWSTLKFAMSDGAYLYGLLNGVDLGITGEATEDQGATATRYIQLELEQTMLSGQTGRSHVGAWLATVNEA